MECANACALSNNKNVRLSVATTILNTSSYINASASPSSVSAVSIIDVVKKIVTCGKYESEPIVRCLVAVGSVLLLQGESGIEVKRIAKERGIGLIMESADIAKQRLQRRRSGSYLLRDFLRIGHNIE